MGRFLLALFVQHSSKITVIVTFTMAVFKVFYFFNIPPVRVSSSAHPQLHTTLTGTPCFGQPHTTYNRKLLGQPANSFGCFVIIFFRFPPKKKNKVDMISLLYVFITCLCMPFARGLRVVW